MTLNTDYDIYTFSNDIVYNGGGWTQNLNGDNKKKKNQTNQTHIHLVYLLSSSFIVANDEKKSVKGERKKLYFFSCPAYHIFTAIITSYTNTHTHRHQHHWNGQYIRIRIREREKSRALRLLHHWHQWDQTPF